MIQKPKQNITAQDVADAAGVSRSAVSRCFSGAGKVSKDKQLRIQSAAEELGYRPNAIARSLTGQKTDMVALIITEHLNRRSHTHLSELTLCLAERGKKAMVIPVGEHTTLDESSLRALDYKVDAIVVLGGSISKKVVEILSAAQVPLFLFGRDHDGERTTGISCDNHAGGVMAGRLFSRHERKRPAYIGKLSQTFSDQKRYEGFVEALSEADLKLHAVVREESTYEGGRRAATVLFSSNTPPDAIFCFNDTVAFGVLQAAQDFNLKIPEDVAILGFDDQPMASWPIFNLSTIGYDPRELAKLATTKVLEGIEGEDLSAQSFHIFPNVVIRKTTA